VCSVSSTSLTVTCSCGRLWCRLPDRGILGPSVATGWATVGLVFAGLIWADWSVSWSPSGRTRGVRPLRRRHAPNAFLISASGVVFLETLAARSSATARTFSGPSVSGRPNDVHGLQHTRSDTHHHHGRGGRRNLGRRGPTGARDETRSRNPRVAQDSETSSLMGSISKKRSPLRSSLAAPSRARPVSCIRSRANRVELGVELGIYAFTAAVLAASQLRGALSAEWSLVCSEVSPCLRL